MSKTSNAAFGAMAVFYGVAFGFGTLLGLVMGIAALRNGITGLGFASLAVGFGCAVTGYLRIRQAIQAARTVNARQPVRAARMSSVSTAAPTTRSDQASIPGDPGRGQTATERDRTEHP